jgi:hypothetical protein
MNLLRLLIVVACAFFPLSILAAPDDQEKKPKPAPTLSELERLIDKLPNLQSPLERAYGRKWSKVELLNYPPNLERTVYSPAIRYALSDGLGLALGWGYLQMDMRKSLESIKKNLELLDKQIERTKKLLEDIDRQKKSEDD